MNKETQKKRIERLEKELWDYKVIVSKLNKEIYEFQDRAEESFLNSPTYIQMDKKIKLLELTNKSLERTIEHEKNKKTFVEHNERGAGRKSRYTECDKENMKELYKKGEKLIKIASLYNCSVGLVHKIINEGN